MIYKVIDYFDLYPNKKQGCKKNVKSKYFRKMRELYERGFKMQNFKTSASFKNDIAVLMYLESTLIGFVFIKEENSEITNGITDPFFYNFVVDPHMQCSGYGSKLFDHIKGMYPNRALYCLTDSTDNTMHEWYDRRDGLVYSNPNITWPDGYFVFIFPNGSVYDENITKTIKETEESNAKNLVLENSTISQLPDHDPTVGDDLMTELDDICGSPNPKDPFYLITADGGKLD